MNLRQKMFIVLISMVLLSATALADPISTAVKAPNAAFSASPTSGNSPLNVTFTDKSTGSPTSWKWNFGDGTNSTVENPSHIYNTKGTYHVTLTVKNAIGKDTLTKNNYIRVLAPLKVPVADFSAIPRTGNAPLKVVFNDLSKGAPASWKWTFGDGHTSKDKSPVHIYSKEGKYNVTLTVSNAAGNNTTTKSNYIVANGLKAPVAAFSAFPTSGYSPLKVLFTDKSTGIHNSWKWTFGDGHTSKDKSPVHIYSGIGNYTVSLTVSNAAGNNTTTKSNYIVVNAFKAPVAAFNASPRSGYAPLKVIFVDKSTGIHNSWKWTFGDGHTSKDKSPVHRYSKAGNYTVSLTVSNAAGNNTTTMSDYIKVKSK